MADSNAIEKAMDLLMKAERPLLVVGADVYWARVEQELKELIELLQIPLHARRLARGVVSETHPLVATGAARPALLTAADVIMIIGLEASYLEGWLLPPVWSPFPKYIVAQETADYHYFGGSPVNVELAIIGNSAQVIRQMLAYAKAKVKPGEQPKWAGWLKYMEDTRSAYFNRVREKVESKREVNPCSSCNEPCGAREIYLKTGAIDSDYAAQQICDALNALDPSGTLILDSYHMSEIITDKMLAKLPGNVVDAGIMQGLGHSIGVGIGLQVGRPGRQSLGIMGDAGFGISCMELETMVRYKLPHCVALVNNSSWCGRAVPRFSFPWLIYDSWNNTPGLRYDLMFAHIDGLHVEFAATGPELRPALDRALQSGKPSLVHWFGDCEATSMLVSILGFEWAWAMGAKRADLSKVAQEELHKAGPGMLLTAYFYMLAKGEYATLEELCELADIPISRVEELGRKLGVM
jgi:thiamine pyrophosphate-dependent acetolactate synthase large subunit-like protein